MKAFEIKKEPLPAEEHALVEKRVQRAKRNIRIFKLVIAVCFGVIACIGLASFLITISTTQLQVGIFIAGLVVAITGVLWLAVFDEMRSLKQVLQQGFKVIEGIVTQKKIARTSTEDSGTRKIGELWFGSDQYVWVPDQALYETVEIGDRIKAKYDYHRNSISKRAENPYVTEIEMLEKSVVSEEEIEILNREDNQYNEILNTNQVELDLADTSQERPLTMQDKRKINRLYLKQLLGTFIALMIGGVIAAVGMTFFGLFWMLLCLLGLLIALVQFIGDRIQNRKKLEVHPIQEIKEHNKNYVIMLAADKPHKIKKSLIDQVKLSHPVIIHRTGWTKKFFDYTFKMKMPE